MISNGVVALSQEVLTPYRGTCCSKSVPTRDFHLEDVSAEGGETFKACWYL